MESEDTDLVREAFGKVLRRNRKEFEWSQEELSHEAGIAMRYVSLLECNKRQPTISTLFLLSRALDISMSEFVAQIEEELPKRLR